MSSTSAIIKMTLVLTPSGNSLQHHMAKVIVMEFTEQLKG
jgi:hypothetical protein